MINRKQKFYVGTAITENYIERAKPYLESLSKIGLIAPVEKFCILIDCESPDLEETFPSVNFIKGSQSQYDFPSLQYGEFIKYLDESEPEDVILFTDADGFFQADPFPKFHLEGNPEAMAFDNLLNEVQRLGLKVSLDDLTKDFPGEYADMLVFNTGFIVASKEIWEDIRNRYIAIASQLDKDFTHYARMQWGLSYILQTMPQLVFPLPPSIHVHGHYPQNHYVHTIDGELYWNNQLICFRHQI